MSSKPKKPAAKAKKVAPVSAADKALAKDVAKLLEKHGVKTLSSIKVKTAITKTAAAAASVQCVPPKQPTEVTFIKNGKKITTVICK